MTLRFLCILLVGDCPSEKKVHCSINRELSESALALETEKAIYIPEREAQCWHNSQSKSWQLDFPLLLIKKEHLCLVQDSRRCTPTLAEMNTR